VTVATRSARIHFDRSAARESKKPAVLHRHTGQPLEDREPVATDPIMGNAGRAGHEGILAGEPSRNIAPLWVSPRR